jgi:hypothetical protein
MIPCPEGPIIEVPRVDSNPPELDAYAKGDGTTQIAANRIKAAAVMLARNYTSHPRRNGSGCEDWFVHFVKVTRITHSWDPGGQVA